MNTENTKKKKNYWFTGDWHLGHRRIVGICKRPFLNLTDMENSIIANHNSVVADDDVVFNLGDVGFRCSAWHVSEKLKLFNGKIVIILGNHDKALRQALNKGMLDKELEEGKIEIIGGKIAYEDSTIAISKMLTFDNQKIFIGHYGHRTWPSAFRNTYHLYAHSHNNLAPFYRSFDVGVDTNNFFPYSLETIINRMKNVPDGFSEKGEKFNASNSSGQELPPQSS